MDRRRKWRYRALAGLQVMAAAAIAAAVIYLLYRYLQYGERFAREAGQRSISADPKIAGTESAGIEPVGEENTGAELVGTEDFKDEFAETKNPGAESAGTENPWGEFAGAKSAGAEQREQLPTTIRVRILTDDFSGRYHDRVELASEEAFAVKLNGKRVRRGKSYSVGAPELEEGQILQIAGKSGETLTLESLNRADGHPRYAGTLWLYREAEGIVLVNELPLEEYLCGVVASEMPSDYPEEAQKAQAVCARTYAYSCIRNARGIDMSGGVSKSSQEDRSGSVTEDSQGDMLKSPAEGAQEDMQEGTTGGPPEDESGGMTEGSQGDKSGSVSEGSQGDKSGSVAENVQETEEEKAWNAPAADLDDSVNYQVYNNYQATEQSRQAVKATEGEVLPIDELQYYSTSCQTEHRDDLDSDEAFRKFLTKEPDAGAEYDSPWLRWEAEISAKDILRELKERYGWQADRIDEIRVAKRAGNGQAQELEVRCGDSVMQVTGEYAVRQLLSPAQTVIRLMDGEEHSGMQLLPSAFFWLEPERIQLSGDESERLPLSGDEPEHILLSGNESERLPLSGDESEHLSLSGDEPEYILLSGNESERPQLSDDEPESEEERLPESENLPESGDRSEADVRQRSEQQESNDLQGLGEPSALESETSGESEEKGEEKSKEKGREKSGEEDGFPIERVMIHGGGYGHGRGMSQCGAAAMAKKGLDYREILEYYYQCEISG